MILMTRGGVVLGMAILVKLLKLIRKVSSSMMIIFMMPGIFIPIIEIIQGEDSGLKLNSAVSNGLTPRRVLLFSFIMIYQMKVQQTIIIMLFSDFIWIPVWEGPGLVSTEFRNPMMIMPSLIKLWDLYGHGVKGNTGYLGYAYMETPGNAFDGIDNDQDGITDESRDSGPGIKIVGQENILNYVNTHYDMTKFEKFYGPVKNRPAYIAGEWWTGDEDMDWVKEFDDTGADGVFGTHD